MVVGMMDETDGSQADETVHFGLDGAEFELNLSKAHAEELRHVLEPYIKAGRKTGSMRNGPLAAITADALWENVRRPPITTLSLFLTLFLPTRSEAMWLDEQRKPVKNLSSATLCLVGGPSLVKNGLATRNSRGQQRITAS